MLNSDEEVLNATLSSLKVFDAAKWKQLKLCKKSDFTQSDSNSNQASDIKSFLLSSNEVSSFNPSESERISQSVSSRNCPEYQNAIEGLAVLNLMYDFYHNKKIEKQDNTMQSIIEGSKDIISPSAIKAKADSICTVLHHLQRIAESKAKLKQVLRSSVMNDFWKIRADYHRSVVDFFALAKEVTCDVSELLKAVQESKKHSRSKSINLHLQETRLLAELQENIDTISEFRNYIQSFMSMIARKHSF